MREKLRFWGLDVHAETIAVAVAGPDSEVRSLHVRLLKRFVRKFIKLGSPEPLRACYEAGRQGSYCTGSWRSRVWSAQW